MPKKYTYVLKDLLSGTDELYFVYKDKPSQDTPSIGVITYGKTIGTYNFIPHEDKGTGFNSKELMSIVHHIKHLEKEYGNNALYYNDTHTDSYPCSDEDCVSHN